MLNALRRKAQTVREVQDLYDALNVRARAPVFFTHFAVADTIDGRFDLVALHAWMVLSRLKALGRAEAAESLTDTIFEAFHVALRELGTGDMGMGPRLKKLRDALNGRMLAYEAAKDEAAFAEALVRNVYRGEAGHEEQARALARYALGARAKLEQGDLATLDFGPLPTT